MRLRPNLTIVFAILLALGTGDYYFRLLLPQARLRDISNDMAGHYDFGGDFYPIWLTGRELLSRRTNPYTRETTQRIQSGLFGRPMDPKRPNDPPTEFRAFAYPLYADLLAAPLLPLEFNGVRLVLGSLLPVLTAGSLLLWLNAFRVRVASRTLAAAVILFMVSYPVLEGLYALQAGLMVAVALALVVAAIVRGQLVVAGVLFAVASVKPQLVWLLALWLLAWSVSDWHRRKGLTLGFAGGIMVLFAASELVLPGWFSGWWHSLVGYSGYTLPPLVLLVMGRVLGASVGLALLAIAGAMCWRVRRQPAGSHEFALAVSFVLAVTVLLEPTGGAVYDQVVLLPAIVWLAARRDEFREGSKAMRFLAWIAVAAIAWEWVAACGVSMISWFSPAIAKIPAILVLPARMAAPVPFVLLALLLYFVAKILRTEQVALTRPT